MKTIMDFCMQVWQCPYLWHVLFCCVVALKMCFLQYGGTEKIMKEHYLHVVIYAFVGMIAGAAAYVGVTDNEVVLLIIFGMSFGVFVALSDNPPITILAIGLGYMIMCTRYVNSWIPVSVYVFIVIMGSLVAAPMRYKYRIRVSQRVVA